MGRPRNRGNSKLPPSVYVDHGRYVYRPYHQGRLAKGLRLCGLDAPLAEVWAAWAAQQQQPDHSLEWLANQYLASKQFRAKAPRTQKDYRNSHQRLSQAELSDGRRFGQLALDQITPGLVRKYLDLRASQGAPVRGNREKAYLSLVWSWGYERDLAPVNPCLRISRNPEKARDKYISAAEYRAIYDLARSHAPAYVPPAMELAYLCRMRKIEVLALRMDDLKAEGVLVRRTKGSRDGLTRWSPRLRAAVRAAQAAGRTMAGATITALTVFHGRDGQPIKESSFDTAWQRLQRRAAERGLARLVFHDLKARGISDFEGDKQQAGGHKSAQMVERYNRKLIEVDATR